ncbi:hypothetical protein PCCS19_01380 [Paenibacillus sp. CCS19]|nr:hypothetical protein PCCS19_01380 [Paenibacillus cellulosilyticus]
MQKALHLDHSLKKVDDVVMYGCTFGSPHELMAATLPHLAESTLPHSFIQPVHEVEVRYAARQDLRP